MLLKCRRVNRMVDVIVAAGSIFYAADGNVEHYLYVVWEMMK